MSLKTRRSGVGVPAAAIVTAIAAIALAGCSPAKNKSSAPPPSSDVTAATCVKSQKVPLINPGVLTIATDSPAYEPWFKNNQPSNSKGFESAVAYAVARQLGFTSGEVRWVKEPFNNSYAPGKKDFDFDINQISITAARAKKVDFSTGYYTAAQAIVVLKKSPYAHATTLADLQSATIGAQVGTTSLSAAQQQIAPTKTVQIYDDTSAATQALKNGQIDALVADLPTAFYITAAEMNGKGTIAGQFQSTKGASEKFGMLFEKGNPLVGCVDLALADLRTSGALAAIEKQWLSAVVNVPVLN